MRVYANYNTTVSGAGQVYGMGYVFAAENGYPYVYAYNGSSISLNNSESHNNKMCSYHIDCNNEPGIVLDTRNYKYHINEYDGYGGQTKTRAILIGDDDLTFSDSFVPYAQFYPYIEITGNANVAGTSHYFTIKMDNNGRHVSYITDNYKYSSYAWLGIQGTAGASTSDNSTQFVSVETTTNGSQTLYYTSGPSFSTYNCGGSGGGCYIGSYQAYPAYKIYKAGPVNIEGTSIGTETLYEGIYYLIDYSAPYNTGEALARLYTSS